MLRTKKIMFCGWVMWLVMIYAKNDVCLLRESIAGETKLTNQYIHANLFFLN